MYDFDEMIPRRGTRCIKYDTLAAEFGITAIVQPGGSVRDEDSIKKADECGIVMLFTGQRHFKH